MKVCVGGMSLKSNQSQIRLCVCGLGYQCCWDLNLFEQSHYGDFSFMETESKFI